MVCGSPERDDSNTRLGLCVDDGDRDAIKQPKSHKSLLSVIEAGVLVSERKPVEHLRGIGKVDSVVAKVCFTLPWIPRVLHLRSVYTPALGSKLRQTAR
jgi:hypothetical protein